MERNGRGRERVEGCGLPGGHRGGRLCGGELEREIRIEAWDYDAGSADDQIGFAKLNVKQLLLKAPIQLIDYKVRFSPPPHPTTYHMWSSPHAVVSPIDRCQQGQILSDPSQPYARAAARPRRPHTGRAPAPAAPGHADRRAAPCILGPSRQVPPRPTVKPGLVQAREAAIYRSPSLPSPPGVGPRSARSREGVCVSLEGLAVPPRPAFRARFCDGLPDSHTAPLLVAVPPPHTPGRGQGPCWAQQQKSSAVPIRAPQHLELQRRGCGRIADDCSRNRRNHPQSLMRLRAAGRRRPEFLDYAKEGLDLRLVVAVDFTSSNGPINEPTCKPTPHSPTRTPPPPPQLELPFPSSEPQSPPVRAATAQLRRVRVAAPARTGRRMEGR
jgi:hypothetical protein